MTTPTGTIDLGELTPDGQPELAAPWPVLVRLRRWHSPRRTGRLAGVTAATVLALLTGTGAAAPAQPEFTSHLALPAILSFEHDRQSLYVVEATESGQPRVRAYRLADGSLRWEAPVPGSETTWLLLWEGALLAQSFGLTGGQAIVLDPGTGRELWRRSGGTESILAGGRYLVSEFAPGSPGGVDEPPRRELTALDPATGQPEWTVPVTGWNYAPGDRDSPYLVVFGGAGDELVSYDLTTGQRLASAAAPVPALESTDVQVVGSLVVLADRSSSPLSFLAYDVATLSPQWTVTGLHGATWFTSCGELLCLLGHRPPRALDPASGELVWSADWLPPADDDLTAVWVSELPGAGLAGTLLLTEHPTMRSWLVDAGTGEPVLDLRDWLLPGWPEPAAGTAPPLLYQAGAERTVIGRLHPDRSGIRALGAIDVTSPAACGTGTGTGTGYVFCLAGSGSSERPRELTVWRHRLP